MHAIRSLPSNPFQLDDVVIRNISTLSWAHLLSIDPNARGTRCHESRNRLGKARERERERVQKPTPLAMPRYKYRTRIERGLIGPVAVFLVRSSKPVHEPGAIERWSMNRSRDPRLPPFWFRVKRGDRLTEDDAARGTFEWGEDGENDKVAGRSWIQASSTPSVERSGLGSMLIRDAAWSHFGPSTP